MVFILYIQYRPQIGYSLRSRAKKGWVSLKVFSLASCLGDHCQWDRMLGISPKREATPYYPKQRKCFDRTLTFTAIEKTVWIFIFSSWVLVSGDISKCKHKCGTFSKKCHYTTKYLKNYYNQTPKKISE